VTLLLAPCDPLDHRRPDAHFAPEVQAARDLGVPVALLDHDALCGPGGSQDAVRRVPASDDAVYRGWMLRSEQYAALVAALAGRGVTVRTAPAAYRRAHELPGWYPVLRAHTPESVWTDRPSADDLRGAGRALPAGAAVLRDHVKSLKHHWDEAMYVPDVRDEDAVERVARDLVRRDDGRWRVVEVGDGQVSDRPSTTPAAHLIGLLFPEPAA